MTTTYPGTIQVFTNPSGTSLLTSPDHAGLHSDVNDTLGAVQTKLGVGSGTAIANAILVGSGNGTSGWSKTWTGGTINTAVLGTPTVTGGTINTAVLGTPTVTGGTINTAVLGTPTVTGGTINTAVLGTPSITGGTLTSPKLNESVALTSTSTELNTLHGQTGAWKSWTPVLTASSSNPNIGSTGTSVGRYIQIGKLISWNAVITASGTGVSSGSGTYSISMPVTPAATYAITGYGWSFNSSFHMLIVESNSRIFNTDDNAQMDNTSGNGGISAAGHVMSFSGTYEAA